MKASDYQFSQKEIKILGQYRDNQDNPRIRNRFYALLMVAHGIIPGLAASITGISGYTLDCRIKLYIEEGRDRLNTLNYTPKQPYLNFFQINQTVIYVIQENPRSAGQVGEYIEQKSGISYCDDAVRKLLKKRGLKILRPKKVPGNPPAEEQQTEFIRNYQKTRESRSSSDCVILFCDAMHLIHQSVPSLCRGDPAFPPVLPTGSGRNRLNIFGAYNQVNHTFIHLTGEENCNSERVVEFYDLIIKSNSYASSIILYRDNAKYFMSNKVQERLRNHPVIEIKPLPPYAPNLNLIGRFRKFAKEKLVTDKYAEKYKTFRAKTFQFLNHIDNYINDLKKLMTEKFEIIYI